MTELCAAAQYYALFDTTYHHKSCTHTSEILSIINHVSTSINLTAKSLGLAYMLGHAPSLLRPGPNYSHKDAQFAASWTARYALFLSIFCVANVL